MSVDLDALGALLLTAREHVASSHVDAPCSLTCVHNAAWVCAIAIRLARLAALLKGTGE